MGTKPGGTGRRAFLQQVALGAGAAAQPKTTLEAGAASGSAADISYPRIFRGRQLALIAFPLGGVAAGSLSLGGRGQLRDWEIFNRADKGNSPAYAFPSIWVQAGGGKPVAKVLEARIQPPYEGENGLGSKNAPGLERLASATFTGAFPLAGIGFEDRSIPVRVSLEAFTPFIPHDAEDSGLPVAVLRYRVANPGRQSARVLIAFSIDNPVGVQESRPAHSASGDTRENTRRNGNGLNGLSMTNPGLPENDVLKGSFALTVLEAGDGKVTCIRGWEKGRWWNSPMLFWDDFSADGELTEPESRNSVGALCLQRTIAPGAHADYTFLLAWHFPNRTPRRCGWSAPKGYEDTVIGNHYATRFAGAWEAAEYAAANLQRLEKDTRHFAASIAASTLPGAVKDAATANLSTLVSTTCFRTADGEFHGFEGVNDKIGCCFGNCTHVWNYETATAHLFPAFARSLRKAAFGYSMDDAGAIHFRQLLPDGIERSGFAAADGQMGQIIHAYLDWRLSGDIEWLRATWPRAKKALEFAWVPGGWDANRDGVMEGVQHNTYDVEFYGPNPQCGIYYLGALRAAEEMARAVGDAASANEYARVFQSGSRWIDANLFNGEYYIQKVRGWPESEIAPSLRSSMGSENTEQPQYQVGGGCLVDQMVGQYLADVAGLGELLKTSNIRSALNAIHRYNYKRTLFDHDSVERIFALNDESALVICDYGKAKRPRIPFPYYAEIMTGFEYSTAAHMIYAGMETEGVECIRNIRRRYDGERRNPWDEAECGHHYARAMAAWSGLLALSGFTYDAPKAGMAALPRSNETNFRCFWSTGTGWGMFSVARRPSGNRFDFQLHKGSLDCRTCTIRSAAGKALALVNDNPVAHQFRREGENGVFEFVEPLRLKEGDRLQLEIRA
ncbi:MAG: GH116 family glycosyl-hydrolase [Bryobacteraceae bacterium]